MVSKGLTAKQTNAKHDEWINDVTKLLSQIRKWCEREDWEVTQHEKCVTEELLGTYTVPLLRIRPPGGFLYVEPVARYVIGAEGRIDIYSSPAMNRMLLVLQDGHWTLKTDSGVNWPEQWNRNAFVKLAGLLTQVP
ncbi:MAG: hypothetical protein NTY65_09975 [Planctomycetota bacterium]|nr:hypothetical protein [Planctomycetota bacterium]